MEGNTSSSEILPQFTDTENMVYLYDERKNKLRKEGSVMVVIVW